MSGLDVLSRYARRPPRPAARDGERCELCATPAGDGHRHVFDLESRAVRCACGTCAALFRAPGAGARLRTVPERVLVDPAFSLTAAQWAALRIPVGLAFVSRRSGDGRFVASYPSPAGAIESELPLDGWRELCAESPLVASVEPDVEALLVHGERGADRLECFLVPIDVAYELAGRVRRGWRGFDGGDEVRRELAAFFEALRARGRPLARPGTGGAP